MKDILQKLTSHAENISLKNGEKESMRQDIFKYMQAHPVDSSVTSMAKNVRDREVVRLHKGQSILFTSKKLIKRMSIILVIALFMSGSAAFAAQDSLPGDTLYPVKTHINENFESAFAISSKSQAKVDARLAGERLREAERLQAEGKLDAETRLTLSNKFETHAKAVNMGLREMEKDKDFDGAAEVSSDFESELRGHEHILLALGDDKISIADMSDMLLRVRMQAKENADDRASFEGKLNSENAADVKMSAEAKKRVALRQIAETRSTIERSKSSLTDEAYAQAIAEANLADALVLEGNTKLAAGASAEAFAFYQKAMRVAHQAKMLILARGELHINGILGGSSSAGLIQFGGGNNDRSVDDEKENSLRGEMEDGTLEDSSIDNSMRVDSVVDIKTDNIRVKTETNTNSRLDIGL